jgi:hypothetical protein
MQIPGIGLLTPTALDRRQHSRLAERRQLACWLGLTPREFSSGSRRRLGRISKQGDAYVRMLLIHGARAALNAARRRAGTDKPLSQLQAWAARRAEGGHPNKAVVALTERDMAARLLERKIRHVEASGAEVIAAANPGCLLQIRAGLLARGSEVTVEHPVDVLARAHGWTH